MKKLLFISLSIALVMVGSMFILPHIKKATSLPDNMVVTYSDIEKANSTNEYSSLIDLELPKNINVANNGELTETTMAIKLFNLFTLTLPKPQSELSLYFPFSCLTGQHKPKLYGLFTIWLITST